MVMAVKTYKEMLFNQNGQDVTIKVGDVTPEGLVLAAMYDNPLTGKRHIVVTTQEHLHDCATWYQGEEMIKAFNEKGEYKGHNIKRFGKFDYADGYSKPVDVLYMMYQNQKEIGGLEPTDSNKYGRVHGAAYDDGGADFRDFDDGYLFDSSIKYNMAAIRPVVIITADEITAKQITFVPRQPMPQAA